MHVSSIHLFYKVGTNRSTSTFSGCFIVLRHIRLLTFWFNKVNAWFSAGLDKAAAPACSYPMWRSRDVSYLSSYNTEHTCLGNSTFLIFFLLTQDRNCHLVRFCIVYTSDKMEFRARRCSWNTVTRFILFSIPFFFIFRHRTPSLHVPVSYETRNVYGTHRGIA